jgi:membrane-anchored protein YejM (alkaline phosphatase superfamily)
MTNRTEWLTFGLFVIAVLGALGFLLRHGGVHGQSAALAIALLVILLLRIGFFAWNLRRQREDIEGK